MRLQAYWELSRSHTYSLILALPLLLGYELLINLVNRLRPDAFPVRNLAELLMQRFLMRAGVQGSTMFVGLLILLAFWIIAREWRSDPDLGWRSLEPRIFGGMLIESAVWALLFGWLVSYSTAALLSPFASSSTPVILSASAAELSRFESLVLSLGAGLYEELFFRVILVSGIVWLLTATGFTTRGPAVLVAVLASALLFSLAHYVGSMGDTLSAGSFIFRFLGGMAFSAIYALRGFGIVTWTHALYDLCIYLFLAPTG